MFDPRLKGGEEARTTCISIEGLECSENLVAALNQHAEQMNTLYRELHALTLTGVDTEEAYAAHFARATELDTWYRSRKRIASSMKSAAARG